MQHAHCHARPCHAWRTQEVAAFFLDRVKHLYGEHAMADEEGLAEKRECMLTIMKGMSKKGGKGGRPRAGHGVKWAHVRAKLREAQEYEAGEGAEGEGEEEA